MLLISRKAVVILFIYLMFTSPQAIWAPEAILTDPATKSGFYLWPIS